MKTIANNILVGIMPLVIFNLSTMKCLAIDLTRAW